jgi:hypothetical protein
VISDRRSANDAAVVAIGVDDDLEEAESTMRHYVVRQMPASTGTRSPGSSRKADTANSLGEQRHDRPR